MNTPQMEAEEGLLLRTPALFDRGAKRPKKSAAGRPAGSPTGELEAANHGARARRGPTHLVVVGNGMVGHRFCERLAELGATESGLRITVLGEEPRPAYDRVHLTNYFTDRTADALQLGTSEWYNSKGIRLLTGKPVVRIDRTVCTVHTSDGDVVAYDTLVLATGSAPFVPPIPGMTLDGVFLYRTIEDLEAILRRARTARRAVVLGGGLLGLEAARAVVDLGLEAHVVELAPRLMPRQLDAAASALLLETIRELGVVVHLDKSLARLLGNGAVTALDFADGSRLELDMLIVSAGIRPRDELAKDAGLLVGERGGIVVDDRMQTSDPNIYAIGEAALHRGVVYGLVAPGYEMADALARTLTGGDAEFAGSDLSAKLKLLGTDVATFGDPFRDPSETRTVVYDDQVKRIYRKLVLSKDGRQLLGGILVGDSAQYASWHSLVRSKRALSEDLRELGLGGEHASPAEPTDDVHVCSCNNVTARSIREAIREHELTAIADVKRCTKAGTGCGGCVPMVTDLLHAELKANGRAVKPILCEHFAYTRQELFQIVASKRLRTFDALRSQYGKGAGCEICKPLVASLLASVFNEPILKKEHRGLQDTNDRYLANIQRNGTYSVIPRIPGGEITPEKLLVLGEVARKYKLYTKITGGQRIDLLGARLEQLPEIWEELVAAGFESGHAYGKAMRTVKSCVGSTWCRYGVQDSTAFAIRIEDRYKGIRAPHKLKSAVSGCVRECAEAQSKDFGLIATERGWNLYVGGNGGSSPRHAELLVADVDSEMAIRYIDRFLMFYIRTADRLTRTSVWLEKLEGGIAHLRDVVVNDSLQLADELERQMAELVDTYVCEWADAIRDPEKRGQFRHFANDAAGDPSVRLVAERGQLRPADRSENGNAGEGLARVRRLPVVRREWVRLAAVEAFPPDTWLAVRYGKTQLAVFHMASRGEWYATENRCPHEREMVLARGIVGDQGGIPKVACPLHKRSFNLQTGQCLSGDELMLGVFPVRIEGGDVWVELPPAEELEALHCDGVACSPVEMAAG